MSSSVHVLAPLWSKEKEKKNEFMNIFTFFSDRIAKFGIYLIRTELRFTWGSYQNEWIERNAFALRICWFRVNLLENTIAAYKWATGTARAQEKWKNKYLSKWLCLICLMAYASIFLHVSEIRVERAAFISSLLDRCNSSRTLITIICVTFVSVCVCE